MNQIESIQAAWKNATANREMTPFLTALDLVVSGLTSAEVPHRIESLFGDFALRVANSGQRFASDWKKTGIRLPCLGYRIGWKGEWVITNHDLKVFGTFDMWLNRYNENVCGSIREALSRIRHQAAYDRFQATGLTKEHCLLITRAGWEIDMGRGDWISIFVQGKRPFGNSSIEYDIYETVGWPMDWPEDDGMSDEQRERAWNLFDELVFAIPEAARLAATRLTPVNP